MNNTILSIEELTRLLQTEEYRFELPKRHYIKEFEDYNGWTCKRTLNLWENTLDKTGVPPTPNEYIEEGLRLTKKFWFKNSDEGRLAKHTMLSRSWVTTYLTWSEDIEKAVKWRLGRMYTSHMAEYSVLSIIHTDFPTVTLLSSSEIDLVLGVDIVTINNMTKKIAYIHITKDGKYAEAGIKRKGQKIVYLKSKNGKKHYWNRQLTDSHLVLLYDSFKSDKTTIVNGHCLFAREFIVKKLASKFEEDIDLSTEENELQKFHAYLVGNKINKGGIKKMIVKYTFDNQ